MFNWIRKLRGPDLEALKTEAAREQAEFEAGHKEPYDAPQRALAVDQRVMRKLNARAPRNN